MKHNWIVIFWILCFIAVVALAIFGIVMSIYVCVTYGNKPIEEVPFWAIWWLFGGK